MADDVAQTKNWRHMATSKTATCQTRVHVRVCVSVCACVCARVRVIKEKAPC